MLSEMLSVSCKTKTSNNRAMREQTRTEEITIATGQSLMIGDYYSIG